MNINAKKTTATHQAIMLLCNNHWILESTCIEWIHICAKEHVGKCLIACMVSKLHYCWITFEKLEKRIFQHIVRAKAKTHLIGKLGQWETAICWNWKSNYLFIMSLEWSLLRIPKSFRAQLYFFDIVFKNSWSHKRKRKY